METPLTASNPRSAKKIVAIKFGELVCKDHADGGIAVREITLGICYACATLNNEPKRNKLAK